MSQSVTICGPNLRDQSKGNFHVHAADCADLKRHASREPEYRHGWTIDATSREHVADETYADIIDENPDETAADYVSDFHFFPCVTLPAQYEYDEPDEPYPGAWV